MNDDCRSVKLSADAWAAVKKLKASVKMPVSINGLCNYLILNYGVPGFYSKELASRAGMDLSRYKHHGNGRKKK